MSVTKRIRSINGKKSLCYRAEVYIRGIRISSKHFDTKSAAYAWHDSERDTLLKGKPVAPEVEMTFDECLNKYFIWAKSRIKESTFQSYWMRESYFRNCILSQLRTRDINAEVIDKWIDWLIKQPTAKNPGRLNFNKELELLSVFLNWYRNYVDATYVVQITKRHREKIKFKPVSRRRQDYFARPEEIRAWINWLRDHRKPVYANLATFMILTGCRVGETSALMWDAVDLQNGLARIYRTVFWDHWTKKPTIQESTKTEDSNRVVVLPDYLIVLLKELKRTSGDQPLVFPNQKGDPLKYNAIQSAFNAGFVTLGLPWRSTHICRHTFATMALFATRDLSGVQASLGHKKRDMTEKYAKAVALLSSGNAEKTAAVFDLSANHAENHAAEKNEGEKLL